jgi:PAS domain S-box-containing protein
MPNNHFPSQPSKTGVTSAPSRRLNNNDRALLGTTSWSAKSTELKFEDRVSVADAKAVFLTGLVTYVGPVHFCDGTWVGIQLIGPSLGKGNCDGAYKGKTYFADVGAKNGVMASIDLVNKYDSSTTLNADEQRATVDVLTSSRVASILKSDEKNRTTNKRFYKEEIYITRLKNTTLGDAIGKRHDSSDNGTNKIKLKYAGPDSTLCECDLALVRGLDKTHQNFCLTDPTLPDNPITYTSQAFLDLTGYRLSQILGVNCRFLQGPLTDKTLVDRIRQSINEGADCHVCLLNYRQDGTPFYNRLFMTALRDTHGHVKNYLGVQCEVSETTAQKINADELQLFQAGMERHGTKFTQRREGRMMRTYSAGSSDGAKPTDNLPLPQSRRPSSRDITQKSSMVAFDMEEAMFRSCMLDDPFAPMTDELEELFQQIQTDPFAGYTTSPVKKSHGNAANNTNKNNIGHRHGGFGGDESKDEDQFLSL